MSPTPTTYQRARSPEQKEERRRHLLDTARAMLQTLPDVHALGMNELARQAGMAKSNVYRYFESSEAVLLAVLVEEYGIWHRELGDALGQGGQRAGTVEHIAQCFCATIVARPLLCRLTSIFPSVLEHNVSEERIVQFKHGLKAVRQQVAQDFHACVPRVPAASFDRFIHFALPMMIGLWPLANPGETAARAMARPDMAALRYEFQQDLEASALVLLRSLAPEAAQDDQKR